MDHRHLHATTAVRPTPWDRNPPSRDDSRKVARHCRLSLPEAQARPLREIFFKKCFGVTRGPDGSNAGVRAIRQPSDAKDVVNAVSVRKWMVMLCELTPSQAPLAITCSPHATEGLCGCVLSVCRLRAQHSLALRTPSCAGLCVMIVFGALFFSLSTTVSMITQVLSDQWKTFQSALDKGARGDGWLTLVVMVLGGIQVASLERPPKA